MDASTSQLLLIGMNGLLGVVSILGSMWLKRMEADVRELQRDLVNQQRITQDKLAEKVNQSDFRDFRQELRENFGQIFQRIDRLGERIGEDQRDQRDSRVKG